MPYSVKIGTPSGNEPSDKRGTGSAGKGPTSKINPMLIAGAVAVLGVVVLAIWWFAGSSGGSGQTKAITFPAGAKGPPIPGPPGAGAGGSASSPASGRMGAGGPPIPGAPGRGPMAGGGPPIPGQPGVGR